MKCYWVENVASLSGSLGLDQPVDESLSGKPPDRGSLLTDPPVTPVIIYKVKEFRLRVLNLHKEIAAPIPN